MAMMCLCSVFGCNCNSLSLMVDVRDMDGQLACTHTKLDVVQHEHCAHGPFLHDGMRPVLGLRAMAA